MLSARADNKLFSPLFLIYISFQISVPFWWSYLHIVKSMTETLMAVESFLINAPYFVISLAVLSEKVESIAQWWQYFIWEESVILAMTVCPLTNVNQIILTVSLNSKLFRSVVLNKKLGYCSRLAIVIYDVMWCHTKDNNINTGHNFLFVHT